MFAILCTVFYRCFTILLARRSIYLETQHPDGLEKIRELESQGRPAKLEIDEPTPTAPTLTELWVRFYYLYNNINTNIKIIFFAA